MTTLQSYDSETPGSVTIAYKLLASEIAAAFLAGIACVAICIGWLAGTQGETLYQWVIITFVAQLALLVVSAGWVLAALVWGGP